MTVGQTYQIKRIKNHPVGVKLICMGISPGKSIQLIRKAPFGGAYFIACDNKRMGISKEDMQCIEFVQNDKNN